MAMRIARAPYAREVTGKLPFYDSSINSQTMAALKSETITAALPMSLARFARRWFSSEMRSTVASTAAFTSSTIKASSTTAMRSARSTPVLPSHSAAGMATTQSAASSRNADSWRAAAARPASE
jgi:hypothetical protein